MGGRIPVVDSFGNLVGWFIPAGGIGCLGMLGVLVLYLILQIATAPTAEDRREIEEDRREGELAAQEMQRIMLKPENYFTFTRIQGPVDMPGCGSYCDDLSFGEYRLTSKTQWVGPALNSPDWVCREPSDKGRLEPGETLTIYCVEQEFREFWTPTHPCVMLGQPLDELQYTMCIDPFENYVPGYIADHFEFDVWITQGDECGGMCPDRRRLHLRMRYTGADYVLYGKYSVKYDNPRFALEDGFQLAPGEEKELDRIYDLTGDRQICADISVRGYLTETVCDQLPP